MLMYLWDTSQYHTERMELVTNLVLLLFFLINTTTTTITKCIDLLDELLNKSQGKGEISCREK